MPVLRAALAVTRVGIAYGWRHRRRPSLAAPPKFTEWVQWRKLHDRNVIRRFTDKAHSGRLAARMLGDAFIIPSLWQGRVLPADPPGPMPFVVKANHGCGQWVAVRNQADYRRARQIAPQWIKFLYGGSLDEWS